MIIISTEGKINQKVNVMCDDAQEIKQTKNMKAYLTSSKQEMYI